MSVAVVAHSGGPTPVINASLLGVYSEARENRSIRKLLGARYGISGILKNDFIDLSSQSVDVMQAIGHAPSSALGTSRQRVDMERVLAVFRSRDVRWLFYTGGNGSMGTAHEIDAYARAIGYELIIVGIPKTIDNDLTVTDHTPGYASTAHFFATAVRDIDADNRALPGQVEIVEILGRNVGWLAAATTLARVDESDGPHLVYLPERRLPRDKFLADVEAKFTRLGRCVVAICEGQLDENGEPFGADVRSGSGGELAMNLGHTLAKLVTSRLNIRARSEKPGLLGRVTSAFHERDYRESRLCGMAAVRAAAEGMGGNMITLQRIPGPEYKVTTGMASLDRVAKQERPFPSEWMHPTAADVLPAFRHWATPLIGVVPPHPRLA